MQCFKCHQDISKTTRVEVKLHEWLTYVGRYSGAKELGAYCEPCYEEIVLYLEEKYAEWQANQVPPHRSSKISGTASPSRSAPRPGLGLREGV